METLYDCVLLLDALDVYKQRFHDSALEQKNIFNNPFCVDEKMSGL